VRVLFVGGGTGGHLTPALGIAEALEARGHETLFLGTGRSIERGYLGGRLARSLGLEDRRYGRFGSFVRLCLLPRAMWRVRHHATAFRADLIVGLGGLASFAFLGARVPRVLLEGNRVAGKAVKLLEPFAKASYCQYPATLAELSKGLCVGPIARNALLAISREEACKRFRLDPKKPVLLVVGGSQGALAVNQSVVRSMPELASQGWQLLALAGPGKAVELREAALQSRVPACVLEHCDDMGAAWSAADLVYCRGGAATLAEVALFAVPALVSPYPGHKDQQQTRNAEALGHGVQLVAGMPAQADDDQLVSLLQSESRRSQMRAALKQAIPQDGRETIVSCLESIVSGATL